MQNSLCDLMFVKVVSAMGTTVADHPEPQQTPLKPLVEFRFPLEGEEELFRDVVIRIRSGSAQGLDRVETEIVESIKDGEARLISTVPYAGASATP